jgi:subtilisin family serine protease
MHGPSGYSLQANALRAGRLAPHNRIHTSGQQLRPLTCAADGAYRYLNGTSMATPIVSGAAAMMLSAITAQGGSPLGRAQELKELLQSSGDLLPGLPTKSSRRLNVMAAVTAAAQLAGASAVAARPVKLDVAGSAAMMRGVRETYFDLKVSILMCSVRHRQHGVMQATQVLLGASR